MTPTTDTRLQHPTYVDIFDTLIQQAGLADTAPLAGDRCVGWWGFGGRR